MNLKVLVIQQNCGGGEQIAVERLIKGYKKENPSVVCDYNLITPFRESQRRFSFLPRLFKYILKTRGKINYIIKRKKYNYFATSDYLVALAFASLLPKKIKLIYLFHGLKSILIKRWSDINYRQVVTKVFERLSWLCAYKIIVPSQESKEFILDRIGLFIIPNKLQIVNNIVPDNYFRKSSIQKSSSDFTILYSGRLTKYKGIENLIEALNVLIIAIPRVKLILAYPSKNVDKDLLAHLIQIAKDRGDKLIEFLPDTSQQDLINIYHRSDVLVLASEIEMAPLSVIEAMATGMFVVGTDVGNIASLLRKIDPNLILSNNSSNEIANKILFVYGYSSKKRSVIKNKIINIARKYSTKNATHSLSKILNDYV